MSDQTFERAALAGKDREQLQTIASAMGVKGVSRMRKADLVDAIVSSAAPAQAPKARSRAKAAAETGNGAGTPNGAAASAASEKRSIRSARASELDTISKIAAEEDAIARVGGGTEADDDTLPIIRPRRGTSDSANIATQSATTPAARATAPMSSPDSDVESNGNGNGNGDGSGDGSGHPGQSGQAGAAGGGDNWQDGDGRRSRRNRRRGRNRDGREPQTDVDPAQYQGELVEIAGLLDLRDEGYGFLRSTGYLPGRHDSYVSASQVRKFALRKGDYLRGATRPASSNEKYPALVRVDSVNDLTPDEARARPRFEDLTPLFPDSQLRLELPESEGELTGRIIDLVAPIGKGQRGMIVSPPKAGKTTIIKQIVFAIERNNPECHVMVLQVDERPEEVTDMRRHVLRAEVVASTFDRPSEEHCHVSELAIERAKRLVEMGKDVVIILDGITRLARAYNLAAPATGRIMSGGIDAGALYPPKKFFGAARNVEEGGSLTILATALVETNSKMDEHIFEEFKGTGNMELRLDRRLADRRVFPAIDVLASGTRHEELLFDRFELQHVWKLRRVLAALDSDRDGPSGKGIELLLEKLRSTRTNAEFLNEIGKAPAPAI
ncbi:MAG TPA: transcription termination factor Rho [Acidimicrobiia bacterium]|jgi:transcription termination factor Rho